MSPASFADNEIRVAAVQFNAREHKAANIATAMALIDRAAETGARLIVLPEVWTYLGPSDGQRDAAETIPGDLTDRLAEQARRHGVYLHAGSFLEQERGEPRLYNTSVVFNPDGEIIAKYRKIHLFDVVLDGVAAYQESLNVAAGNEIVTFDLDGMTVGLAICYDLRFPELFRILALRGAEAIVLPAAFTLMTGRDHWEVLIRARAIENQVFMIAPNQYGPDSSGKWCYGRSMIVDPWGTVLATAADGDGVIATTLDRAQLRGVRRQVPSLANRMPERYEWPEGAVAAR